MPFMPTGDGAQHVGALAVLAGQQVGRCSQAGPGKKKLENKFTRDMGVAPLGLHAVIVILAVKWPCIEFQTAAV